jgi:hypothetical protein
MATRKELTPTSFDHEELKQSLIDFLASTQEFGDFNYEGSAINTLVDLLTRNSVYAAYMANMVANESFIDSAQLRANVISHAQKLSYLPRSAVATRLICDIEVTPATVTGNEKSIVMQPGTAFIANFDGVAYSFTTHESYTLAFSTTRGTFMARDVMLYQGQRIKNSFAYDGINSIVIPNQLCDRSTLRVVSDETSEASSYKVYKQATSISDLSAGNALYFLKENTRGRTVIEFGKNLLGREPAEGTTFEISYIMTEEDHANGISKLIAASTIDGYSDISIDVTTNGYGGSDKEDTESIRFAAPKLYQIQDRALSASDYVPLLKQRFSFIKSAISWGGEENLPPRYGAVFISVVSDEGGLITNSVKQQMENYLNDKNVGSITPVITDPVTFGIDLDVSFVYDERYTKYTYNDVVSAIKTTVENYNSMSLDGFESFYNESELSKRILDIDGITSLEIDKYVFNDVTPVLGTEAIYQVNFDNPVVRGTVEMIGFKIADAEDHKLYDDKEGGLWVDYYIEGRKTVVSAGKIDYEKGVIDFSMTMLQQSPDDIRLYCKVETDNFYVRHNKTVYINNVKTAMLSTKTRRSEVLLLNNE